MAGGGGKGKKGSASPKAQANPAFSALIKGREDSAELVKSFSALSSSDQKAVVQNGQRLQNTKRPQAAKDRALNTFLTLQLNPRQARNDPYLQARLAVSTQADR